MLLAIDSGNTNIVFAVFDGEGAIRGEWRSSTNTERTADEYGVWLGQLMQKADVTPGDVDAAIISTVVPATLHSLKTLSREYFDCEPLVVGEDEVDLEAMKRHYEHSVNGHAEIDEKTLATADDD